MNNIKDVVLPEDSELLDSYGGGIFRSTASSGNREFLNIEPGISVRNDFTRADYAAFRGNDPKRLKDQIAACMEIYYGSGIVKNIIDLMADFACQGISIVHTNKREEAFYRNWYNKIGGGSISERFCNYLFRTANVVVNRSNARITKKEEQEFKKASASADLPQDQEIPIYRRQIPWSYEFLNPLYIDFENVKGQKQYFIRIANKLYNSGAIDVNNEYLPDYIKAQIADGKRKIILNKDTLGIYYYKKDDWLNWAVPMIKPILPDLYMLDKMKLADSAACDGIISSVRLWTVGSLEHKIPPKAAVINRVKEIISSHTGGGVFDLVWGPELSFTESSSQIYKCLGNEKYIPILNNIYMGFGISAALAGTGTNGGYTNNFVSIKTLIERLEYCREVLTSFWNHEFEIVRKAMKFKKSASIHFDSIILSDEAAIKTLLINLVDRNIISEETLLERFREIPEIEKIRVERESNERQKNPKAPKKAGPFHNPHETEDLAKQALNSGNLGPEYFDKVGLPFREAPLPPATKSKTGTTQRAKPKKQSRPEGGRPINTRDTKTRKQRRVLPRSKGIDSNKLLWAINAQHKISEIITPNFLTVAKKKNVRSLSNEEFDLLEQVKLKAFLCLDFGQDITESFVNNSICRNIELSDNFKNSLENAIAGFIKLNTRTPNVEEMRTIYATIFAQNK